MMNILYFLFPSLDSEIVYQAASPDEAALVKAAKYFGFFFHVCDNFINVW